MEGAAPPVEAETPPPGTGEEKPLEPPS